MRVFMTGASGWIGSAVVPELIEAGHEVVGLARSDESGDAVLALGAEVWRGDLEDTDGLRAAAAGADGVIHLAFIHDFSNYGHSLEVDQRAIEAFEPAGERTHLGRIVIRIDPEMIAARLHPRGRRRAGGKAGEGSQPCGQAPPHWS